MNINQSIHYILENLKMFDMEVEMNIQLGLDGSFIAPINGRKYTYQEIRNKAHQFRSLMEITK